VTIAVIIGMALVTYVPRLVPFYLVYASTLPQLLQRAMRMVPYAALGALIVPSAFSSVAGELLPSTIAIAVAALTALLVRNVALCLLAAVGAAALTLAL
jgi:branched-subunit amino acid transport protein